MIVRKGTLRRLLAGALLLALLAGALTARDVVAQTEPGATAAPGETAVYTLRDHTLVDTDICLVKIVEVRSDEWELAIRVHCENRSDTKTLAYTVYDCYLNGYWINPFWAELVDPGLSSDTDISFMPHPRETIGVDTADEVSFVLRVFDCDKPWLDAFVEESFTLYPTGLAPEAIVYPPRPEDPAEGVMVDDDRLAFVLYGVAMDSETDGYGLWYYLENRTQRPMECIMSHIRINGCEVEPHWVMEVLPGKRCYDSICLRQAEMEALDSPVEDTFTFTLEVYDTSTPDPTLVATYEDLTYTEPVFG